MSGRGPIAPTLALALLVTVHLAGPAVAGATARETPTVSALNPDDVDVGDTTQTIHLGGRVPEGTTRLTLNVTPLAEAGVDLSSASVAVARSTPGLDVETTLERTGDRVFVHADLDATEEETGFRLSLRLEELDTSDAAHAELRYDGTIDGERFASDRFRLEAPGMPDVVAEVEDTPPVVDRPDESLRLRIAVVEAPGGTPVTLRFDLAPLQRANVSLEGLEARAEATEPGTTLHGVDRNGSTLTVRTTTDAEGFAEIELVLDGLDTRRAEPTEGLRLPIAVEAPAGSKTVESSPFGLYRPGEAPTPTETVVESPTATETATAAGSSTTQTATPADGQPGFTAGVALLALGLAVVLARRRR